jgi:hypothetical protein
MRVDGYVERATSSQKGYGGFLATGHMDHVPLVQSK